MALARQAGFNDVLRIIANSYSWNDTAELTLGAMRSVMSARGRLVFGELPGWLPGCSRTRASSVGAQSSSNSHDPVRVSAGTLELCDNGVPALWRPCSAPVGRHAPGRGYRSRTTRRARRCG